MKAVENRPGNNLAFTGGISAILVYLVGAVVSWWFYPRPFTPLRKRVGALGFAVVLLGLAFHIGFPRSRPLEWATELGFLVYVGLLAYSSRSYHAH